MLLDDPWSDKLMFPYIDSHRQCSCRSVSVFLSVSTVVMTSASFGNLATRNLLMFQPPHANRALNKDVSQCCVPERVKPHGPERCMRIRSTHVLPLFSLKRHMSVFNLT